VIFDFSGQHDVDAWHSVDDVVMGGVSASRLRVASERTAFFEGVVSLDLGGGFASVTSRPSEWDLTDFDGVEIRLRGDGRRYRLRLRTGTGASRVGYQASFQTKDGLWQKERLPFEAFEARYHGQPVVDAPPLDASGITSLGLLIADRQAGPFRLEIDWIRAYAERDS
jgi:monofunctional biosynthetic peptidoglycan transglycosylase